MSSLRDNPGANGKEEHPFGRPAATPATRSDLARQIAWQMLRADHQALEREIRVETAAELSR